MKIVELSKTSEDGLRASQLVLELSGKNINTSIVNSLKRVIEDNVPTYAFFTDNIIIEKNTSVFDNDYMRLRLQQFTIPNLKIPVTYLHDDYWKYVDYSDPERKKHPDDNRLIEFSINAVNNTKEVMNVTTGDNEFRYFEDGTEDKKKFFKSGSLLIKLKPGQEFKCSAKATLGCGRRHDIWSSVANCYFETDDEEKIFKFTVESQGQLDEYKLLQTGCEVIKAKLQNIRDKIDANSKLVEISAKDTQLHIKLDDETHTIGNIINDTLQDHPDILYSGMAKPDVFKDEIFIKIESKKPNPIKYLFEAIDQLGDIYDEIHSSLKKKK